MYCIKERTKKKVSMFSKFVCWMVVLGRKYYQSNLRFVVLCGCSDYTVVSRLMTAKGSFPLIEQHLPSLEVHGKK